MQQKISLSQIYLYKEPLAKGFEKDIYKFCVKPSDNQYIFLTSKKAYSAEKVEDVVNWYDNFRCLFNDVNKWGEEEVQVDTTQKLSSVLACDEVIGSLPKEAVRYLNKALTELFYSPKKLLEVEQKFVEIQFDYLIEKKHSSRGLGY